jgi:hypothetical protein
VLIPIRKFSENAEERRKFRDRTIEGLKTQDGISYRIRKATQPRLGILGEIRELISNDESCLIASSGIGTVGKVSYSIDEMVETIPKIGDGIANHQAPTFEVGLLSDEAECKPMFGELLISFVNESIGISVQPCQDFSVNSIEVLACPI